MVPSDAFREQILSRQKDLRRVQASAAYAHKLISKEKHIGPGQCGRIVNSIRSAEEPLREFYEFLESPEQLPLPARSFRHPLLLLLDNVCRLLSDLIENIDSLHIVYRTASHHDARLYREQILEQLEDLERKKDDIAQNIDYLLIKANAHR